MSRAAEAAFDVVERGIAGSVRDGGRPGLAHVGRSRGGAVDLASLELGNRLLGNPPGAAAFETSGGLAVRIRRAVMVAVTGSPCDLAVGGGPALGWGVPAVLPAGSTLRVGRLRGGARSYVCVRGGLWGDASRAGAGEIAGGAVVDVGPDPGTAATTTPAVPWPLDGLVRVWPGPRLDWFAPDAIDHLIGTTWRVGSASDRVGARLDGPTLVRVRHDELPSEGMVEGALQVPPDGRPIVLLADHPATGGYPVVAVVDPGDLRLVAQRGPGAEIRFTRAR